MTSRKFFLTVKKCAGPRQYQQPSSVKEKENNGVDESTFVPDSQSLHEQTELNSLYCALLDGLETASTPSLPESALINNSSTPPSHNSTNNHLSTDQLWSPLPQPDLSLLTRQCLLPRDCDDYQTKEEKSNTAGGDQHSNRITNSQQNSSKSSQPKKSTRTIDSSKLSPESLAISNATTTTIVSKLPPTDIIDLSEESDDMEFNKLCMEVDLTESNNQAHSGAVSLNQVSTETNCQRQTATSSSAVSSRATTNRTKLSSFVSEVQGKADTVASHIYAPSQVPKSKKRKTHKDREEAEVFTCSSCDFSFPLGTTKQQYRAHVEQCSSLDDVIFIE